MTVETYMEHHRSDDIRAGASRVGLCASCVHSRVIESRRGSRFYLCLMSETDARFRKYPQLPVSLCAGHAVRVEAAETQRVSGASND
jgi:hypothetical protein